MATTKGLHYCIDACNGGIRLQAVRYGVGWYCLIVYQEQLDDEVWIKFDDLICGDNSYFNATDYFKNSDDYTLTIGDTPMDALALAEVEAASKLDGYDHK